MARVCEDYFKPRLGNAGKMRVAGFHMDLYLKQNLDILYKKVYRKNFDGIIFIDGVEGFGKSHFAQQAGFYLAKGFRKKTKFGLNNIVFTPEQFTKIVLDSPKFTVIIWDEARSGINARRAMSATNNAITDMLAEIRQKNLFIFIVMPTFMDSDKNVAVWRSRALIHIHGRGFERGYYKFFGYSKKRMLYFLGKKQFYNYNVVTPDFSGRFGEFWCIDELKYKAKKLGALRAYGNQDVGSKTTKVCKACKSRACVYFFKETQLFKCNICNYEEGLDDVLARAKKFGGKKK